MEPKPAHKAKILFLFSDTGGGHRSAAEAIIEAVKREFPGCFETEMVDFFREYAPPPLDKAPEMYPPMARVPDMWELGYRLSNGPHRTQAITDVLWPYYRNAARRLVADHPCDIYVAVHPVVITPLLRVMKPDHPPFITVVTDMVSTHAFWYHRDSDVVFVPTDVARTRGIEYGLDPGRIQVVGLPVDDRYCHPPGDPVETRRKLGWPTDKPVILLVAGGEGMGPMGKTAFAIDSAHLDATLVAVAGRNHKLRASLEKHSWKGTTRVYGFVKEMPDFMRAADFLVTKAGPGTISEAFITGLPLVLYSRMPGQEDGNVTYVVNEGAGVWAPHPDQVVSALQYWLKHPAARARVVTACKRLARPDAARRIAREIARQTKIEIKTVAHD
ncbi:MAG: glycosyltransferase [Anaerolineaceae bacterium]|nr:glycosyltransferase [Anaerolineaceae bacterium]